MFRVKTDSMILIQHDKQAVSQSGPPSGGTMRVVRDGAKG